MPISLTSILWVKQLAIRLGCKQPQPNRWLSRLRESRRTNRYASFTLIRTSRNKIEKCFLSGAMLFTLEIYNEAVALNLPFDFPNTNLERNLK